MRWKCDTPSFFPSKLTGLWLVNHLDQLIRCLFYWRETTWTHVLTLISEETDFSSATYFIVGRWSNDDRNVVTLWLIMVTLWLFLPLATWLANRWSLNLLSVTYAGELQLHSTLIFFKKWCHLLQNQRKVIFFKFQQIIFWHTSTIVCNLVQQ